MINKAKNVFFIAFLPFFDFVWNWAKGSRRDAVDEGCEVIVEAPAQTSASDQDNGKDPAASLLSRQ